MRVDPGKRAEHSRIFLSFRPPKLGRDSKIYIKKLKDHGAVPEPNVESQRNSSKTGHKDHPPRIPRMTAPIFLSQQLSGKSPEIQLILLMSSFFTTPSVWGQAALRESLMGLLGLQARLSPSGRTPGTEEHGTTCSTTSLTRNRRIIYTTLRIFMNNIIGFPSISGVLGTGWN